ncbi:MAG: hypothetical protein KZQ86_11980, partial [Candidatus Thiodiazotropha sp. (ex Lucinoma kastoroae)]|nr:hypothetical protein [Candidatus Thiodiazotropha sp. (ex Lucinoma kastoroae)]
VLTGLMRKLHSVILCRSHNLNNALLGMESITATVGQCLPDIGGLGCRTSMFLIPPPFPPTRGSFFIFILE